MMSSSQHNWLPATVKDAMLHKMTEEAFDAVVTDWEVARGFERA